MVKLRLCLIAAVACSFLLGCGPDGPSTFKLTGNVTYDGKPVPVGTIVLTPDSSAGNKGPGAATEIKNGQFATAPGKGHVGGAYTILVNGYDGVPVESGEGGMDPNGKPLFSPYTTKVELPNEDKVLDIEVPAS